MTTRTDDINAEAEHWAQHARSPLWQDQDSSIDTGRACLWAGIKAAVVMAAALLVVIAGFSA